MDSISTTRSARYILTFGIISGLIYAYMTLTTNVVQLGLASRVYYAAATAALAGDNFYLVTPPTDTGYYFIYPPIVVTVFFPHAQLGTPTAAFLLQTLLNGIACLIMTVVLWRSLRRRSVPINSVDRWIISGFVFLSVYGVSQVIQGQTTLWLAMALVVGFDALERDRAWLPGITFALAALVKLFPAVLGLWLLRRGKYRETAIAIGTGFAGLIVGLLVLGSGQTEYYFRTVLTDRFRRTTFDGTPDPSSSITSAQRQFSAILDIDPNLITPLIIIILLPVLVMLYHRVDTDNRRIATILGTLVIVLLIMPFQPLYFSLLYYPVIILVYTLPGGRARTLLLGGIAFSFAMFGFDLVADVVNFMPLPGQVTELILGAAESVFTVILPPTVGMWLMLGACLLVHFDSLDAGGSSPES